MSSSRPLMKAAKPLESIGQLGGHVKTGIPIPIGKRTGASMALLSALPLAPGSDMMVLTFLDRSDPVETFDYQANSGDNAVLIVPKEEVKISIVKGVCPGDWRGVKVEFGEEIEEPVDLDVDPTGMDLDASDAWVDMVDELGCDCSKVGGFPLWSNAPVDVEQIMGKPMRFHSRLTSDIIDYELADGGVVYTFVAEDASCGCVLWQKSGGGAEKTYHHYQ